MIKYTGFIRKIRYYSESSHYIVALLEVEEEQKLITMNGYMSNFNEYDKYLFFGNYEIHPKYGQQLKLDHYEVVLSTDEDEMIKYLSSPLFKGIGPTQAKYIVDTLGKDALTLIKEDKHHLDNVKGMTAVKRDHIYEVLTANDYDQEVIQFFMGHGISMRHIGIIQETYKEKTLEVLQNHPYQLIEDIDGIGFKTADELALKLGGSKESPERLKAAVLYSVKRGCFDSGSTYMLYDEIKKAYHKNIGYIDESVFNEYLETLIDEGFVIQESEFYYDKELYDSEEIISSFLKKINSYPEEHYDEKEVERLLTNFQDKFGIEYSKKQKEAIDYFLKYPMMILTGGPGTGKTTTVKALIRMYRSLYPNESISLVAPTGRAAKRLSELTGLEACTIHRELKWDLHKNTFAMNKNNPLSSEVLIIDEFSMVDSLLLSKLFEACRKVHKVLFIGDYHQLPSVAPGNVLKDFIESHLKVIELDEIYRQAKDSGIVQLAHQLIHQEVHDLSLFDQYKDINFFNSTNFEVVKNVVMIVKKAIESGYDQNDIQVLAPIYKGVAGIDALNLALQEVFNPKEDQDEYRIGPTVYRVGDKILQTKNRPDDDVYNGDIGVLVEIGRKDGFEYLEDTLIVDFDGNFVEYTSKDFLTFTLAYCMSIHKAQGNEFKIVIMPVLDDYYIMLKRNLIYTGLTRAKQSLFILGSPKAFLYGIQNVKDAKRKTTLTSKINQEQSLNLYDFLEKEESSLDETVDESGYQEDLPFEDVPF